MGAARFEVQSVSSPAVCHSGPPYNTKQGICNTADLKTKETMLKGAVAALALTRLRSPALRFPAARFWDMCGIEADHIVAWNCVWLREYRAECVSVR